MSTPVSGHIARLYLLTLQEVAGPQYPTILQQAGWSRYSRDLPPATDAVVASEDEGRQMTRVIYAMLGEDLFRLFSRNVGTTLMRLLLAGPWADFPAQVAQIPAAARPRWVMEQQAALLRSNQEHVTISEDATAWYSTVAQGECSCEDLHGAKTPICTAHSASLKLALETLCGRPYRVAEITCEAMGAPNCQYAVYKPG